MRANRKKIQIAPILISISVIAFVCACEILPHFNPNLDFFGRLEWITYDWRVRAAMSTNNPVSPNLGAVFIDDESLQYFNQFYQATWPLPRSFYAKVVKEL